MLSGINFEVSLLDFIAPNRLPRLSEDITSLLEVTLAIPKQHLNFAPKVIEGLHGCIHATLRVSDTLRLCQERSRNFHVDRGDILRHIVLSFEFHCT